MAHKVYIIQLLTYCLQYALLEKTDIILKSRHQCGIGLREYACSICCWHFPSHKTLGPINSLLPSETIEHMIAICAIFQCLPTYPTYNRFQFMHTVNVYIPNLSFGMCGHFPICQEDILPAKLFCAICISCWIFIRMSLKE